MARSPFHTDDSFDEMAGGFSPPRARDAYAPPPTEEDARAERAERKRLKAARAESMKDIRAQLDALKDSTLAPTARIEQLMRLQSSIMVPLLEEVLSETPDVDRSVVCARALTAVRDTVAMVAKKHDLDSQDDFNPNSPKFQVAFGWFIDLVHRVLQANVPDETLVHNVFNDLQNELAGFEDALTRRLRGVTARSYAAFESPFVADWRERLRQTAIEHQRLIEGASAPVHATLPPLALR